MTRGLIFDLKRFSVHDGPGIRSTVFLKGCPFQCPWCHNPESRSAKAQLLFREELCLGCAKCVEACPEEAIVMVDGKSQTDEQGCRLRGECVEACPVGARELLGRQVSVEGLLVELQRDRVFYEESGGGVTFSGGEPLAQADFLIAALEACDDAGLHRAVDTTGHADSQVFRAMAERADLVLFDLKIMDPDRHRELTGTDNALLLSNLKLLGEIGCAVEVRVPVIPGVNDDEANIKATAEILVDLKNLVGLTLLPFHSGARDKYPRFGLNWTLSENLQANGEKLEALASILRKANLPVSIGGEKDE
ncbi:glycyl-radical enzyme activating protein [bacterium]|nr:glycyl-radical enzyme activating protein [bacterium]